MGEQLTPWFPPEVKPVRVGLYQRDYEILSDDAQPAPDYWNGRHWFYADDDGELDGPCAIQWRRWRGLANPPKGAAK